MDSKAVPARRPPSPTITLESAGAVAPPPAPEPASPGKKGPMDELDVLIRARYPIIYVVSWEEERVEQNLRQIAAARNKRLHVWTCTQGILTSGEEPKSHKASGDAT